MNGAIQPIHQQLFEKKILFWSFDILFLKLAYKLQKLHKESLFKFKTQLSYQLPNLLIQLFLVAMSNQKLFLTPLKGQGQQTARQTICFTADRYQNLKIDYKAKTFQLMKTLTEFQLRERKQAQVIFHLERQLEICQHNIDEFLKQSNQQNLIKASINRNRHFQPQNQYKETQLKQLTNIIAEYKKLIQGQQSKLLRFDQQNKKNQIKLLKMQQEQKEEKRIYQEIRNEIKDMNKKNQELRNQNKQLREIKNKIQNKYHDQIVHFEDLQRNVEEKLKEVHRDILNYQRQREDHQIEIQMLKKQLQIRQIKAYFSFGGTQTAETQTQIIQNLQILQKQSQTESETNKESDKIQNQDHQYGIFSSQCFQASIKTLLQQNARLKDALMMMHKHKGGQIPRQAELQIKILLSMNSQQVRSE